MMRTLNPFKRAPGTDEAKAFQILDPKGAILAKGTYNEETRKGINRLFYRFNAPAARKKIEINKTFTIQLAKKEESAKFVKQAEGKTQVQDVGFGWIQFATSGLGIWAASTFLKFGQLSAVPFGIGMGWIFARSKDEGSTRSNYSGQGVKRLAGAGALTALAYLLNIPNEALGIVFGVSSIVITEAGNYLNRSVIPKMVSEAIGGLKAAGTEFFKPEKAKRAKSN